MNFFRPLIVVTSLISTAIGVSPGSKFQHLPVGTQSEFLYGHVQPNLFSADDDGGSVTVNHLPAI